jgi:hypothetical protein
MMEAVRHSESARILSSHSLWVVYLGEAWLREGRPAEARGHTLRARALARVRGERGFEAWASWLLGEIAAREDARTTAMAAYRAALDMVEPLDMHPLAARSRTALSRLTEET